MPHPIEGRLVVATHNPGKLREFRDLLAPYIGIVTSAGELGLPEPEETGNTFTENALLKARAAAQLSNSVALADDSGLCVTALGGAPGIYSARWANPLPLVGRGLGRGERSKRSVWDFITPLPAKTKDLLRKSGFLRPSPPGGRDFTLAIQRVHNELGASQDRSAYFICVLVLVWPDGREEIIDGRVDGHIAWPPRGDKGHGYDPVFVPEGESRTFAEMDDNEKNAISHRGIAVRGLIESFSCENA